MGLFSDTFQIKNIREYSKYYLLRDWDVDVLVPPDAGPDLQHGGHQGGDPGGDLRGVAKLRSALIIGAYLSVGREVIVVIIRGRAVLLVTHEDYGLLFISKMKRHGIDVGVTVELNVLAELVEQVEYPVHQVVLCCALVMQHRIRAKIDLEKDSQVRIHSLN